MNTLKLLGLLVTLVLCGAGAAPADERKDESGKAKEHSSAADHRHDDDRDSYFHRQGHGRLDIPPGHYPAPGECRVWHPGRPPGHQPPPGKCDRLRAEVPPGAWLIHHPHDDPAHVHVIVYEDQRPGTIFVVGEFEIATGVFVRVVVDR